MMPEDVVNGKRDASRETAQALMKEESAPSPSPSKKRKEAGKDGAGTPPMKAASDTPSSAAVTKSRKKPKNPIFDQFFDKSGQSKAVSSFSSKENKKKAANGVESGGGFAREVCFKKAQQFKISHPCPFAIGDLTVTHLGNIMVEKGPKAPLFHRANSILPIAYKSVWKDPMTGTEYTNEVLDGMDVLGKDVLACSVSWAGENVKSESLEEAWQEVKRKQIADGSEQDRASAAAWPFSGLEERFGLSNVDVRKRIEGMRGSADCFMYRFLNEKAEGEGGATKSPAKTPAKGKVAAKVQSKLTFEADGKKKGKGKKATTLMADTNGVAQEKETKEPKKGDRKKQELTEDAPLEKEGTPENKNGPKVKRTGKSALQIFSKEVRERVKAENPEVAEKVNEVNRIINKKFKELPAKERAAYEARSTRQVISVEGGDQEGSDDNKEEVKEEEDTSMWHREGSKFLGKRGRRYIYDARGNVNDAAHGTILMWLPKEVADYVDEETGEPGALWRLIYDDAKTGADDLDEQETKEAIALMEEELPEKVKEKMKRREEKAAEAKVRREAADQLKVLRQQAKQEEKERKKQEKEQLKTDVADSKKEFRSDLIPGPDESMVTIKEGPHKGRLAIAVKQPEGSTAAFPPPSSLQDFLPVFMFLRDLSGPLGAVRMSFEEVKTCLQAETEQGKERFCDIARWLTDIAVRTKWVHDEQADVDTKDAEAAAESVDCMDLSLAPGPLLNAKSKDSISYSCWQLINESSWPELARMLMRHSNMLDVHQGLHDAMGEKEPADLTLEEKLSLLRFLCDEACSSDKVQLAINSKLRQIDRILEKKRQEDVAIRRRNQHQKQQEKQEKENQVEAVNWDASMADADAANKESENSKEGRKGKKGNGLKEAKEKDVHGEVKEAKETPADDVATGGSKVALTAVQTMLQPFTMKYKEQDFEGTMDVSNGNIAITCNGHTFSSPIAWVKWCLSKSKPVSIKSVIRYKGKSLKRCEEDYKLKAPDTGKEQSMRGPNIEMLIMEQSLEGVDPEKRSREIQLALEKASKGLRHEPIGYDRWWRSYYAFDGVPDVVWACDAPAQVKGVEQEPRSYGFDGLIVEEYKTMNAEQAQRWTCYTHSDGTLKALCDVLMNGPKGPREQGLIDAMHAHRITKGFEPAGKFQTRGENVNHEGERGGAERRDDGYDWAELPEIGDVVWARGKDRGVWIPVKLVDPPGECPSFSEAESDDETEEGFQDYGSQLLGKRVRMKITDKKNEREVDGTVRWFLPLGKSDFVSEQTGKVAALFRVKFDDHTLTNQDLEDFEVREAMLSYAKAEAQRLGRNSDILSSRSMFGQEIKWVYGQLFTDKEPVEKYLLEDLQPFLDFREIRQQEMRRANKNSILRQVALANEYIEGSTSMQDQEQEFKVVLHELRWSGTTEQQMTDELKASCNHCMRYPRVLNVVQDSREQLPALTDWKELRVQLRALHKKMGAEYVPDDGHNELRHRLRIWLEQLDEKDSLEGVVESMRQLEQSLNEDADKSIIEREESMPIDLDDWRTEGHVFIGKRLAREIKGRFGHTEGIYNARVVGWLPIDESDYTDQNGKPSALWHVVRDTGEEEDLEDFEVEQGMQLLIRRGDHPDHSRHSGIWVNPRDRERWARLVSGARTTGAAALALYILGDAALSYMASITVSKRLVSQEWDEYCFICAEGGNLLCCDGCPRTVHSQCVGLPRAPKGDFFCFYCEMERERSGQPKKDKGKSQSGSNSKSVKEDRKEEEKEASTKGGPVSRTRGTEQKEGGASRKRKRDSDEGVKEKEERKSKKTVDAKMQAHPETREELESLRKMLVRNGAMNGSVAEVQADAKAVKRDERWFVQVTDGDVINKKDSPALKEVHFFTDWKPKKGDKIKLDPNVEPRPLDIASILSIGRLQDMLRGSERKGFLPTDLHL